MSAPWYIAQNLNSSDPAVGAAIAAGDADWLRACARRIEETGVDFIDCNAGSFADQEAVLLGWLVEQVGPGVRIPLAIDSANEAALAAVASRLRGRVLLNSLALDFTWSDGLRAALVDRPNPVVLSLRRGGSLPDSAEERMRWAAEGMDRLTARGVPDASILVDAIALPWGDDVQAGRAMLDFVAQWAREGAGRGPLVGLGNLGHGHADPVRIHREWMGRLRNVGIAAVLCDAFEPGLREDLPGRP